MPGARFRNPPWTRPQTLKNRADGCAHGLVASSSDGSYANAETVRPGLLVGHMNTIALFDTGT